MPKHPIKIAGMGRYLPERVVPSSVLEAMCNLEPGWVERYNGVRERRWITHETASFMAAEAAREAVTNAGLTLQDIDLIINASGTSEQAIPDGGPLLQRQLGLVESGVPTLTVHSTCLSFLTAINVSTGLLLSNQYKCILVTSSEITSCAVNVTEPESATLLGDAAAAAVLTLSPENDPSGIEAMRFETYSEGAYLTTVNVGTRYHPNAPGANPADNFFRMDGPQVLRRARKYSAPFLERVAPGLSKGLDGISAVIPHQASLVGLRMMRNFNWPEEKVVRTLEWLGNCVAASIPCTLYEAISQGKVQRTDRVLLVGTGAGFSLGAILLVY